MKRVLLFGAGKSATVLIDYLLANAEAGDWRLAVVDADISLARDKIGGHPFGDPLSFDVRDEEYRNMHIRQADVVISMLPPALHFLVAKDCLFWSKHLFTASYVDEQIARLEQDIHNKDLLFLCEMGLDPGIDHMSAMEVIDQIHGAGGRITSFRSHCGGMVAPESDDNPWHYKISWNPRNVVLAGKAGAHFRDKGQEVRLSYNELFTGDREVEVPGIGFLEWYPNRDSLSYATRYGLHYADTFIRTTLRHADFMFGWRNIIELHLTDEEKLYDTDGKSLAAVFRSHLDRHNFAEWLQHKMTTRLKQTQDMLSNLTRVMEAEQQAQLEGENIPQKFLTADNQGNLDEIEIDDVKTKATAYVAHKMHEANLTLKQLICLGLDDQETIVNKGLCSAADILQFSLENKLRLLPADRDMVVMLHEFEYTLPGSPYNRSRSTLVVRGEDRLRTAMAKTVGLPLGIAVKLLFSGELSVRGLRIPTSREIYAPVLRELTLAGIRFDHEKLG